MLTPVGSWGGGAGSYPLSGVVGGSYVYLAGICHDGTDLSKITQTASFLDFCDYSFDRITVLVSETLVDVLVFDVPEVH